MNGPTSPIRLEANDVGSWIGQPGRRMVWFHSPCDGPGAMVMEGWRQLPVELRASIPLRMVLIDDIPSDDWYEFGVRWNLRHQSEITLWGDGQLLLRGVPQSGPGRRWEAWLQEWQFL